MHWFFQCHYNISVKNVSHTQNLRSKRYQGSHITYVTGYWKPTKLLHLAYSILLAQLIASLIHYPCTVALTGLTDWSAFLELILQLCKITTETMGPWRALDGRYGSDIHPCVSETSYRSSRFAWAYD